MILNRKKAKNSTDSTMDNQALMLRTVTSYSIFLLIILILFFHVYHYLEASLHLKILSGFLRFRRMSAHSCHLK